MKLNYLSQLSMPIPGTLKSRRSPTIVLDQLDRDNIKSTLSPCHSTLWHKYIYGFRPRSWAVIVEVNVRNYMDKVGHDPEYTDVEPTKSHYGRCTLAQVVRVPCYNQRLFYYEAMDSWTSEWRARSTPEPDEFSSYESAR